MTVLLWLPARGSHHTLLLTLTLPLAHPEGLPALPGLPAWVH